MLQAPPLTPPMGTMGMATQATMRAVASTAPMGMGICAMKTAALSVATMEMKMAARSLSGGVYFLPYPKVTDTHFSSSIAVITDVKRLRRGAFVAGSVITPHISHTFSGRRPAFNFQCLKPQRSMDDQLPIPGNYHGNTSPSRSRLQVNSDTHTHL